jgi:hypothetical protein
MSLDLPTRYAVLPDIVIPEKGVFYGTQNVSPLSGIPLRALAH